MEEVNHQNFGIKLFSEYVAEPSAASFAEPEELQSAIEKFPYCQLLHLFYSRSLATKGSAENKRQLERTAVIIPDRAVLYTVLNNPEKLNNTPPILTDLKAIPDSEELPPQEEIVIIEEAILIEETIAKEILKDESLEEEPIAEQIFEEITLAEEIQQQDEVFAEENAGQEISQAEIAIDEGQLENNEEVQSENIIEEQPIPTNQETEIKGKSEWSAKVEPQSTKEPTVSQPVINDSDLIDNIFNQLIGAVPPPITPVAVYAVSTPFNDEKFLSETKDLTSEDNRNLKKEQAPEIKEEIKVEEKAEIKVEQPLEKIADPQAETKAEETVTSINEPVKESPKEPAKDKETDQNVSKYDDDKMPYSFLWWLNKTRNEYADTYQPYVEFKLDTTQTIKRTSVDQLSSQIIENIFHLQSPLEEIENGPKTVPFQVRRKEDSILEKFIKEEPQIKPPSSQKLDTENKARKSAEDANDLVSETLAQIYIDQMLFQKAIDTFKKLSLKFPEKSTYFADQIIELEKKVN